MRAVDVARTALGNTLRSKLRTLLTVVAIVIGAFTLTLTSGLGAGINKYVDAMVAGYGDAEQLYVVQGDGETLQLTSDDGPSEYDPQEGTTEGAGMWGQDMLSEEDIETLEGIEGIISVDPIVFVTADYLETPNGDQWSTDELGFPADIPGVELAAGETPERDAMELTIPETWMEAFGADQAKELLDETVEIAVTTMEQVQKTVSAKVVGVSQQAISGVGGLPMPSQALNDKLYETMNAGLEVEVDDSYVQAAVDVENLEANEDPIKSALQDNDMTGTTAEDQLGAMQGVINAVTWVLSGFALIALLAASFGIVNTLLMSVQERTREIGLMKALGMRRGRVFGLFSLEAVMIGLMGSITGLGLGLVTGIVGNSALINGPLSNVAGLTLFAVDPIALAAIAALIVLIAFLAGTLPAARAAKKDPIAALRYE